MLNGIGTQLWFPVTFRDAPISLFQSRYRYRYLGFGFRRYRVPIQYQGLINKLYASLCGSDLESFFYV